MLQGRYRVPLSPPNSPRMSDAATKSTDHQYQQVPQRSYERLGTVQELDHPYACSQTQSSLRHDSGSGQPQHFSRRSAVPDQHTSSIGHVSYHGSAPGSPGDRLTPRSPASVSQDQLDDDDDLVEYGGDDQEDDDDSEKPPMTAAELRAAKRKMKRFRLTHNQTRFLMSEFARQAHPDAAHRERLSREIPGLSARQVQVWFQNRRAKLKRLTNDDRERMLRSRALPADFDTTQALHSPFGAQAPSMAASISSVGSYGYADSSGIRPLTLDTLRRVPDYEHYTQQYAGPTGVSPALSAFGFTPPHSTSDHLSPGSVASSMSPYVLQHSGAYDGSRRPPTGLPTASNTSYPSQTAYPSQPPYNHRGPLHERLGRTMGETMGSPLRASVSYAGLTSASAQPRHIPERAASFSDHTYNQQRPQIQNTSSPNAGDHGPYGLGFSYSQVPLYQQQHEQQTQHPVSGAPQTADAQQYRRSGPSMYAQYPPLSLPGQYPAYGAQYPESYQNSFSQHGQVTEPVSQATPQQQGYQTVTGASQQPYMQVSGPHGHRATDHQSGEMPPSY